jgi:hypothetical protein
MLSVTTTQQALDPDNFQNTVASQTLAMMNIKQQNADAAAGNNNGGQGSVPQSPVSTSEATPPNTPFPNPVLDDSSSSAMQVDGAEAKSETPATAASSDMDVVQPEGASSAPPSSSEAPASASSESSEQPKSDDAMDVDKPST